MTKKSAAMHPRDPRSAGGDYGISRGTCAQIHGYQSTPRNDRTSLFRSVKLQSPRFRLQQEIIFRHRNDFAISNACAACIRSRSRRHASLSIKKASMSAAQARDGPTFALSGADIHTLLTPVNAPVRRGPPVSARMQARLSAHRARWPLARHLSPVVLEVCHVDKEISQSIVQNPCEQEE